MPRIYHAISGLILAAAIAPSDADAQSNRVPVMQPGEAGSCPAVKPSGDVVILSMYGGSGQRAPYSLEGAQHHVSIVKVSGDKGKSDKITLVLSAYESTVWDLSEIKNRIAGVMVYGHYPQAISGLPKSVPAVYQIVTGPEQVKISSTSVCFPGIEHEDMYKIQRQAKSIQAILGGVHPRRWYGGYSPSAFSVDGGSVSIPTPVSAATLRTNVPVKTAGLMPGNDGLEQLVQAGVLRRFSKKDVNAWSARGAELNMIAGPMMAHQSSHDPIDYVGTANSGYLLLKNLNEVPAGLGGANSAIFVVPEGLAMPMQAGHSTIYQLSKYPGQIPPPGELIPIDRRDQTIRQSNMRYTAANKFIEWDKDGNVINDGTSNLNREIPTMAKSEILPPLDVDSSQNRLEDEGETTGSSLLLPAIILILLAAIGGAIFWYVRNRAKDEKGESPDELRMLLNDLDRVIQNCDDDATSLSISRFKRLLIKAVNEADFDDDLVEELNLIASVHIPSYTKSYLSAVKLGKSDNIETKLRQTIDMMSKKIENIIVEQRSRYNNNFEVNDGFVKQRHDDDKDIN